METTSKVMPKAKLLLPKASLASCLFGALVRDTRGCNLTFQEKFNHFGSSPLCCISFSFEGQCHLVENNDQLSAPSTAPVFPRIVFSGPQQMPQTSWNAGDVCGMMLVFYPDAFTKIAGINVAQYANMTVPIEEVLSDDLLTLVNDVLESGEPEKGFELIENKLTPVWQVARPVGPPFSRSVSDWCKALIVRAAFSKTGKSTRQLERRIKAWAGQSKRSLMMYVRGEQAFRHALSAKSKGELDLADMSAKLGYSDQSHMGRQVKELTGFSPAEFLKRYDNDEAFWSFRLVGERF